MPLITNFLLFSLCRRIRKGSPCAKPSITIPSCQQGREGVEASRLNYAIKLYSGSKTPTEYRSRTNRGLFISW